ncbi:MAG: magnesium transporter [Patescibacteria group bacterium]
MKERFIDVFKTHLSQLIEWRTPWLILGLFGGMIATAIVSSYEAELDRILPLAFFIPVMVYMGDAVGTQSEMLFVRELTMGKMRLGLYLFREFIVDVAMGIICATLLYFFALIVLNDATIATTVGVALMIIMSTAGVLATLLSSLLVRFHRDPAIGAGPFTTIVQDIASLLIYFAVASYLLI